MRSLRLKWNGFKQKMQKRVIAKFGAGGLFSQRQPIDFHANSVKFAAVFASASSPSFLLGAAGRVWPRPSRE